MYDLQLSDATVLCLGCDERKVIAGCSDRLIRVYDIRSGRLVSVLKGHKVCQTLAITPHEWANHAGKYMYMYSTAIL